MKLSNRLLASIVVIGALACAPAAAQAGTISTETVAGSTNQSILRFTAAPGEQNRLRVEQVVSAPGAVALQVTDSGAPLTVGPGCTGAAPGGWIAICTLHPGQPAESEYCGRDCFHTIPGTAWETSMKIALGDGDDSFDGSSLIGTYYDGWAMTVEGGTGNDTILTGGAKDTITPGPGNDLVRSGGDIDLVIADPTPDGNDVLELGTGTLNGVDYSARTEPLHLAGGVIGGAGGEEDHLAGFNEVIGGSGNDDFHSSGEFLKGGPGDDTLIGSAAKEEIYGGTGNDVIRGEAGDDFIYGGEGDDRIDGGAGNDMLEEREEQPASDRLLGASGLPSGGNDVIEGGEGDDFVLAGLGEDTVEGGPGNDRLYGEAGNDILEGAAGNDEVAGEAGADSIRGGEGDDLLLAGRIQEWVSSNSRVVPVDTAVDALDCGPGNDTAEANPWDGATNCETRKRIRAVRFDEVHRNRRKGLAVVGFDVAGPGELRVGGRGVRSISRPIGSPETEVASVPVATHQNLGRFTVRPIGRARAKLRRHGHVLVTMKLTWSPVGQAPVTETWRLKLIRR